VVRIVEHEQVGLPGHILSHSLEGYTLTIRYDGQEHVVDLSDAPPEGLPFGGSALPAGAFLGAEWDGEDLVVHVVVWREEGADSVPQDLPETEQ
jgi:hypothetical protein